MVMVVVVVVFLGLVFYFYFLGSSLSLSFSLEDGSLRRRKENVKWREEWDIYRGDFG